ncbi:hypothetical protein BJX61DRAFT_200 [Aspergillus egyptiacus]|nr:hypothetical protein BJX61DRAFT_200 [Aspergillus egyptiacus]
MYVTREGWTLNPATGIDEKEQWKPIKRKKRDKLYMKHEKCLEWLAQRGVFVEFYHSGRRLLPEEETLCQDLLATVVDVPEDRGFDDHHYHDTLMLLREANEVDIQKLIGVFVVPSLRHAMREHGVELRSMSESTRELWDCAVNLHIRSIPESHPRLGPRSFQLPLPQPDHTVGFRWYAFTEEQCRKLWPAISGDPSANIFKARTTVFFPFLTAEVRSRAMHADFRTAELQNTHSMAIAMRGVVKLFSCVNREQELHGRVLGFSLCYDNEGVSIAAHWPYINGAEITYNCRTIKTCKFNEDRWTAYRFVMGVYSNWAPDHLERLRSAIDAVPEANFFESPLLWPSEAPSRGPDSPEEELPFQGLSDSPPQTPLQPSRLLSGCLEWRPMAVLSSSQSEVSEAEQAGNDVDEDDGALFC